MSATDSQCEHWRDMRPRREAVIAFVRKWYSECGVWPGPCDVEMIFGISHGGYAGQLLREAFAMMERKA